MKYQFVSYELALKLKELGFDQECIAGYYSGGELIFINNIDNKLKEWVGMFLLDFPAPLWQQAFDWLLIKYREIYNVDISLTFWFDGSGHCKEMSEDDNLFDFDTKIECLDKLINIVTKK